MPQVRINFTRNVPHIDAVFEWFFDAAGLAASMDEKTSLAASSAGAFGRTVMQRGMRYRLGASAPGDFPSAHKGNPLLRELIYFGYDPHERALFVGPVKLNRTDRQVATAGKTLPQLINEGGAVVRGRGFQKGRGVFPLRKGQKKAWRYRARPFVALTMPKVVEKFQQNLKTIPLQKRGH